MELEIVDIETSIKAKKKNILVKQERNINVGKFCSHRVENPTNKQNWTELVQEDLAVFGITQDLDSFHFVQKHFFH